MPPDLITRIRRALGAPRARPMAAWAWQGRPPPDDWQPAQQSLRHRDAEGRPVWVATAQRDRGRGEATRFTQPDCGTLRSPNYCCGITTVPSRGASRSGAEASRTPVANREWIGVQIRLKFNSVS